MRLLTPEISWHETLPVYSCDLQHRITVPIGVDVTKPSDKSPLSDITGLIPGDGHMDTVADPGWTRLATAGGDNVVRLWRVRLGWITSNSNSASVNTPAEQPTVIGKKTMANHTHTNLAEHLTYLASLRRHEKPVNVVRWSPSGDYLASAGDDLFIIIWSNQTASTTVSDGNCIAKDGLDDEEEEETAISQERWVPCRSLRRHLEDIYDLCWSPDGKGLISGSVDHSIIIWQLDLEPLASGGSPLKTLTNGGSGSSGVTASASVANPDKPESGAGTSGTDQVSSSIITPVTGPGATKNLIVRDHKHYVQGVAWDPVGVYVASLSCDRACRVYQAGTRTCLAHVSKAGKQRLFQDDSWKSFFRRLSFSPDGLLLACPAGNLEEAVFAGSVAAAASLASTDPTINDTPQIPAVAPQHAAHLFLRSNFSRPVVSLPTGPRPVVCVRFCLQPFQLRPTHLLNNTRATDQPQSLFDLPYRWLFCLVLEDGILFYDTQQTTPFAQVSQFHYQALNDASWSKDGHLLVVCSTDGYCSLIHFARGELGTPYHGPIGAAVTTRDTKQSTPITSLSVKSVEDLPSTVESNPPKPQLSNSDTAPACSVPLCTPHPTPESQIDKLEETSKSIPKSEQSVPSTNATNAPLTGSAIRKRRVALTTVSSEIGSHKVAVNSPSVETKQREQLPVPLTVNQKTPEKSNPANVVTTPASARKRRVTFVTLSDQPIGATMSSDTANVRALEDSDHASSSAPDSAERNH